MFPLTGNQKPKSDPAPSVWTYRLNRLMLTPLFRVTVRLVLPVAALCLATWVYFSDAGRREAVVIAKNEIVETIKNTRTRKEAADVLGISQRTLRYKIARMREKGISVPKRQSA